MTEGRASITRNTLEEGTHNMTTTTQHAMSVLRHARKIGKARPGSMAEAQHREAVRKLLRVLKGKAAQ